MALDSALQWSQSLLITTIFLRTTKRARKYVHLRGGSVQKRIRRPYSGRRKKSEGGARKQRHLAIITDAHNSYFNNPVRTSSGEVLRDVAMRSSLQAIMQCIVCAPSSESRS